MKVESWTQLHDVVVTSAVGLFTSIGLSAVYGGSAPKVDGELSETLSIIGFAGQLRGCLVLSVPTTLLERSLPSGAKESADVTDWLTLANLLLGRIKIRLLTRGVTTELSTPLTLSATTIQLVGFSGMPIAHSFHVGSQTIYVVFGAMASDDLCLIPSTEQSIVRMGDIVMF